ncbi:MAG: phosphoglycolate phosphatase [Treponema sp.]|nr:MAG: phosphoglycolate phosphatase [Treponema sp.]
MKACIFDLDGTLTDTVETLAYFVNAELAKYDMPAIPSEKFKIFTGDGARNLIRRALAFHGRKDEAPEDKILQDYNAAYDANFLYKCKIYDGICELVNELKARGLKIAVVTNKPQGTAEKVVEHFFGAGTFEVVVGQREGFPIKPDPAGVFEVLEKLHLRKDECIYIGDTGTDMKTGKSAGLFTVGVLWGFRSKEEIEDAGADVIVSQPSEILRFV